MFLIIFGPVCKQENPFQTESTMISAIQATPCLPRGNNSKFDIVGMWSKGAHAWEWSSPIKFGLIVGNLMVWPNIQATTTTTTTTTTHTHNNHHHYHHRHHHHNNSNNNRKPAVIVNVFDSSAKQHCNVWKRRQQSTPATAQQQLENGGKVLQHQD